MSLKSSIKTARNFLLLFLKVWKWGFAAKDERQKRTAFVFGVSKWKQEYVRPFLAEFEQVYFVPTPKVSFFLASVIRRFPEKVLVLWGIQEEEAIERFAAMNHIPLYHLEDGFVRSVGLGAMHTPPYSLCVDKKGIYFDATRPSDLEEILNSYTFDEGILEEARAAMRALIQQGMSKYNHIGKKNSEEIYGPKKKRRILVIGQVEDDASIKRGSKKVKTNLDLIKVAYAENQEAEIFYKPHPDVLSGKRPSRSSLDDAARFARIIEEPLSLADSFETIDHVYTITSLSGFEACIRGIPVTTLGAPFYSGWGITDDRQKVPRRKRKLSVEEVFAGAYLLYPTYIDPETKETLTLMETIRRLQKKMD